MITLKEAKTKKEMKAFVKFPFSLYKNDKYWVPPIINDELEGFNKDVNPAFKFAEARFFIAYKNNKAVGRIAAIINWTEVNEMKIKKMRFGWFDFIDDIEVSTALLDKVKEIGQENNLEYMEGPVGFTNLDKVGVLTEGFDTIGSMVTWYNYPYYQEHFNQLGYQPEKEYDEHYMLVESHNHDSYSKIAKLVREKHNVREVELKSTKDVLAYADQMFDLLNKTYAHLSSYVPISEEQKEYFKKKFISFINPDFLVFIVDENDKLIAFAITMPAFAKALQKSKGKLFPFGIYHLLKAKNKSTEALLYLIGIEEEYRTKGVITLIFDHFNVAYAKRGITKLIRTPELADNVNVKQIWKRMNPVKFKVRKTFKKDIA